MKQALFYAPRLFVLIIILASASCKSGPPTTNEIIECKGKCVIVFKPDSVTVKQYLDETNDATFMETMNNHERYADSLKQKLNDTDVRFVSSTARFITVDNGSKKEKIHARADDGYPFGVILVRPEGAPMVHYGIYTEVEYEEMMTTYFAD